MANCVDPDEMAHYELSHPDLHCLQSYLYWLVGMNGLTLNCSRRHNKTYFKLFFRDNTIIDISCVFSTQLALCSQNIKNIHIETVIC